MGKRGRCAAPDALRHGCGSHQATAGTFSEHHQVTHNHNELFEAHKARISVYKSVMEAAMSQSDGSDCVKPSNGRLDTHSARRPRR
jgi:hypothetical protein